MHRNIVDIEGDKFTPCEFTYWHHGPFPQFVKKLLLTKTKQFTVSKYVLTISEKLTLISGGYCDAGTIFIVDSLWCCNMIFPLAIYFVSFPYLDLIFPLVGKANQEDISDNGTAKKKGKELRLLDSKVALSLCECLLSRLRIKLLQGFQDTHHYICNASNKDPFLHSPWKTKNSKFPQ